MKYASQYRQSNPAIIFHETSILFAGKVRNGHRLRQRLRISACNIHKYAAKQKKYIKIEKK